MLKSILVGLDGSDYSATALEVGIQWAKQFDALLVGLGVIDEPGIRGPEAVPLTGVYYRHHGDDARLREARVRVEQSLERFALRCAAEGVPSKPLEDMGLPAEEILAEAQRFDLILLGLRTYFHFETRDSPCDTLRKVLRNAPRPVVTVPEKLGGGTSVVVAYDGSVPAARTLQAFEACGLAAGREVHVIGVADDYGEAARHTDRAAEFLRPHGVNAQVHPLASSAKPAEVLLEQARRLNAGLVVMGAYGEPRWREFLLGSVTRTVLRDAQCPLFLYH